MRTRRAFVPVEQWSDPRQRRGLWGERVAIAYLTSCGWRIERHRFRMGHRDLDIVARRDGIVAFIEVKTRSSTICGAPSQSIGWRKRHALAGLAEAWRDRHGARDDLYRFDVVEVLLEGAGRYRVVHVEDAWRLQCD